MSITEDILHQLTVLNLALDAINADNTQAAKFIISQLITLKEADLADVCAALNSNEEV